MALESTNLAASSVSARKKRGTRFFPVTMQCLVVNQASIIIVLVTDAFERRYLSDETYSEEG